MKQYSNIAIMGNDDFTPYVGRRATVIEAVYTMLDDYIIQDVLDEPSMEDKQKFLQSIYPMEGGYEKWMVDYIENVLKSDEWFEDKVSKIASILSDTIWCWRQACGFVQREWNIIYYNFKYFDSTRAYEIGQEYFK